METPLYINVSFLIMTAVLVFLLLRGIWLVQLRAGLEAGRARSNTFISAAIIGGWLAILAIVAATGWFAVFEIPPRVPPALMLPFIIGWVVLTRKGVKRLRAHLPESWVIYPQVFRLPLELMLYAIYLEGTGPIEMTFAGYNFDIISGIIAPIIAFLVIQRKALPRWVAIAYNYMGLVFIAIVVTVAVLTFPVPGMQLFDTVPNTAVAYWPLIWLPGFVVPLALLWHIISLQQLHAKK